MVSRLTVLLLALLPVRGALGARGREGRGSLPRLSKDFVVTSWNILSLSRAINPFEFSGSSKAEVKALENSSTHLKDEQRSVSEYIRDGLSKVESAVANCRKFEVKGIEEKCSKAVPGNIKSWLRKRVQLRVSEFWKAISKPTHKLSKVSVKWQRRAGFNEVFNCNPLSKNGELSTDQIEFTDVIDLLLFDTILNVTYDNVKKLHPSLDATRESLCESMFSSGFEKRMTSVVKVLADFGTDFGFLNEIPKTWLVPAGAGGGSPLQLAAAERGFAVVADLPRNLDKDDNTVILVNESSWRFVSPVVAHRAVGKADIKGLSVEVVPKFEVKVIIDGADAKDLVVEEKSSKPVTLLGMHLDSKDTENEARMAGVRFAAGFQGAVISAADTNGDPRSSTYKDGTFFYELMPEGKYPLYRATEAPWHRERPNQDLTATELGASPAYGTCNKVRTSLQSQLRKAGVEDRLMKDNIYYKSGDGVTVAQLDLCRGRDCDRYTYDGQMECFSVEPTHEELHLQGAFPTTCGYLGETRLPDMSQDWAISDHAPVAAKFSVTQA
mmetsp:Transcript_56603/g.131959  ORF Transcript_56603/g.131959 Transcript_56603/m.131959 type:complete len:553 (-) Transcript_56603:110-1768(-)|eukprot:CAMPEP_0171059338 /NCGR_PEP_ID=MMETSP0766_2-20121228/3122_1 /TAXON_ID=439317 /ORGANISM="Gambierdiscus australes, Strain CAWD 149" /LENGTH=552 /DNA_ID=CAMNT_0011514767 /DNA_START=70 /DNA_END=1728 /DNA_ORIENTATION=+